MQHVVMHHREQQINLYGFREAIEMFAVLFLFHKIFMESETFDQKCLMLDSCFVLLGTHQQHPSPCSDFVSQC